MEEAHSRNLEEGGGMESRAQAAQAADKLREEAEENVRRAPEAPMEAARAKHCKEAMKEEGVRKGLETVQQLAAEEDNRRAMIPDHEEEASVPHKNTAEERREARRRAREKLSKFPGLASVARIATITSTPDSHFPDVVDISLQIRHTCSGIISSTEASLRFSSPASLLGKLNEIRGTCYTFVQHPELVAALQSYIDMEYDFGLIYAYLRPGWHQDPVAGLRNLAARTQDYAERRAAALDRTTNSFVNPNIPPRRIWDLYSNRVVPFSAATSHFLGAVSHSWMEPSRRQNIQTAINSFEWPVPIPNDITLERVRVEILNLGLQYAWLDVLCLRQEGAPEKEATRREEWLVDVPTIGSVYTPSNIVIHYYSGLGRPFRIENLDHERHWINRAWTLQEVTENSIIAGVTPSSPVPDRVAVDEEGSIKNPNERRFYEKLSDLKLITGSHNFDCIYPILTAMRPRSASSELDKIAGLAYRISASVLPPYIVGQSPEHAWDSLVKVINPDRRGDLLFMFPEPGKQQYRWCPSWQQIKDAERLPSIPGLVLCEAVEFDVETGCFSHKGFRFDGCHLQVESEPGNRGYRNGVVQLPTTHLDTVGLTVIARHAQPIPTGTYTLICSDTFETWVVGRPVGSGLIEKVSVLRTPANLAQKYRQSFKAHVKQVSLYT
ncbi:hypothetical protein FB45DRAFT_1060025 [Roridomyces roridus]|uniref:Heterokaryon incompatibility domain-containing protein n=1 Tax=Roridomyces roridus TaxID=1738132 RepID=A0AAD7FJG6_9AGAR|nr:hypothetical protein FB45DRAFT_1060025 [Roridomyces roridus]